MRELDREAIEEPATEIELEARESETCRNDRIDPDGLVCPKFTGSVVGRCPTKVTRLYIATV